jgi:hypothetical protein
VWDATPVEVTADQAVAAAAGEGRIDRAVAQTELQSLILAMTKDGPVKTADVDKMAADKGFTAKQIRTAKGKLHLQSTRVGDDWMLSLPELSTVSARGGRSE